jgi:hypothetical protein
MRAALALTLLAALLPADEPKAVASATEYLLKTQAKDGSWDCLEKGLLKELKGFSLPNSPSRVWATSLCGWALLEHGARPGGPSPADQALTKARDYVTQYLLVGQKSSLGNPTWVFAMGGLFLAKLHRVGYTEEGTKAIQAALDGLEEFVETTGYWGHGRVDRPSMKLSIGYNDLSPSHNWVAIALSEIAAARIGVPERLRTRAVEYYAKTQFPGGGLAYNIEGRSSNKDETSTLGEGRSVTSLLPLRRLAPKSPECAAAEKYARANLDKVLTHHTPWLHLLGAGLTMDEIGNRAEFDRLYKARMLAQQDADGSAKPWTEAKDGEKLTLENFSTAVKAMADKDDNVGRPYSTACFLLLLKPTRMTRTGSRPDVPSEGGKKR